MNYIFTVLFTSIWMFGLKQGSENLRRLGMHPVLLDLRHYSHKSTCKIHDSNFTSVTLQVYLAMIFSLTCVL